MRVTGSTLHYFQDVDAREMMLSETRGPHGTT